MNITEIHFHTEDVDFQLQERKKFNSWIKKVAESENKAAGNLNFIFCSDTYLLEINRKHLNHDTFTDIVTFNYNENTTISGDIFISVERVKENAIALNVDFNSELKRVIIHGVLHLIGYNDKTADEVQIMRAKEDFYITLLN